MKSLPVKLRMRIKTIIAIVSVITFALVAGPFNPTSFAEEPAPAQSEGLEPGSLSSGPAPLETPIQPEQKPIRIPLTEVIGTSPNALDHIPGSGRVITNETLQKNRRFTINEALREVPGVNVRDEEGFGLRPNIGIRGLNPTRSSKIHIMEDGVPIMLMPYADQTSYFFPPLFRFDRIEVLKGSGQLLFGPQNIGGVMNLITRMPPLTPTGNFEIRAGNLSYLNTHFDYGGTWGSSGYLLDVTHFQGTSPRFFNQHAKVDDVTFKSVHEISDRSTIMAKFNYYREDSTLSYQGLTEQQYRTEPRYLPFTNDQMDFRRLGVHVAHQYMFNANLSVTTNFFGHYIDRKWGRQSSDLDGNPATANPSFNTGNTLNSLAPLAIPAGGSTNNGRFLNDRQYWVYGVEPRFHLTHRLLGINSEADFGARYMHEESTRRQFQNFTNPLGLTCPTSQTGCLGEDTLRHTNAYAVFFQNRFFLTDQITVTPGVRVENVNYDQVDRRAGNGGGTYSKTSITEVLPGIGATYSPVKNYTIFAGVHRGFAPPTISDAIQSNVVVDLDAELSWNYELGLRGTPTQWSGFELTLFQMDFQNQIISQSLAGGSGATNTNGGRTRHRGIEVATKIDVLDMVSGPNRDQDILFDINYTWVADAEFRGTRNSALSCNPLAAGGNNNCPLLPGEAATVSVSGNRLTYAPRHMLSAGIGYVNRPVGFDMRVETQCISDMFSDDRNSVAATPNGQRGVITGWCVLNAAANQYVKPIKTTFFLTGKNLLDQTFIVDRSRGIYPGLPLLVQGGARWTF
jgi:Fe(3+) dicitrate transport protein